MYAVLIHCCSYHFLKLSVVNFVENLISCNERERVVLNHNVGIKLPLNFLRAGYQKSHKYRGFFVDLEIDRIFFMSLSPEYNYKPEITIPTPEDAGDMLRLRARLYTEELMLSGVPKEAATRHTEDWTSSYSIEEYCEVIEDWLTDPVIFLRTVHVKTEESSQVRGIFLGVRPTLHNPMHFVRVIQLDESIRRRGVGRRLFEEMASKDPTAPMELNVLQGNEPAQKFYRALGFTAVARDAFVIGDEHVPVDRMRRPASALLHTQTL